MSVILVTIDTPNGPLDLSVPARLEGGELVALLAHRLGSTGTEWELSMPHRAIAIGQNETLADAGVLDGTILEFAPVTCAPQIADTADPPAVVEKATRALPERVSTGRRIGFAIHALFGLHEPTGADGPLDRARYVWKWTDHTRRLEWLASRPRLLRTVTVGVVGHRSAEVATSLTATLDRVRHDRVVLMAEPAPFDHARRDTTSGPRIRAIEAGLRAPSSRGSNRDALFSRTASGALLVPLDRSMAPDTAAFHDLLDSLASHAGVVIIDCGTQAAPDPATDGCYDQVIHSSTGARQTIPVPTIVARWGGDAPKEPDDQAAGIRMDDDPVSMLELAVVVVAGWAQLGAATPMPSEGV